ncbi:hypothetical protein MRX96_035063 [Rhipicephalus microplus]
MLDRELGLAAIFQPSLTTARRRKQANSVVLFIDAPESTPSMRLKDHPRSRKLRKEAAQVLAIDEQLSSVIQMRNELPSAGHSLASSVSAETSNNGNLVRGALMSENATGEPRVLVQVDSPGQLEKLVSLLDGPSDQRTSQLCGLLTDRILVPPLCPLEALRKN